jgi:hypothetical protein
MDTTHRGLQWIVAHVTVDQVASSTRSGREVGVTKAVVVGIFVLAGCVDANETSSAADDRARAPEPSSAAPAPEVRATAPDTEGTDDAGTSPPSAPERDPPKSACPAEMVLVEGRYCPDAVHVCKRWLDPPGRFREFRCAEYAPSICKGPRKRLRFCIDRDEYTAPGGTLPEVDHSWTTAKKKCESFGKRLCLESEWQFACEGEEIRPYPYGFSRDASACNIDRENITGKTAPIDYRQPAGSNPRCVSPFGVRDMSGNIEEWATIDGATTPGGRSTMKGAWWLPGRNHCRARTLGHGEVYFGPQIGIRCCKGAS